MAVNHPSRASEPPPAPSKSRKGPSSKTSRKAKGSQESASRDGSVDSTTSYRSRPEADDRDAIAMAEKKNKKTLDELTDGLSDSESVVMQDRPTNHRRGGGRDVVGYVRNSSRRRPV